MRNVIRMRDLTVSAASNVLSFLRYMQGPGTAQPTRRGAAAIQRCMDGTADEQVTIGSASTCSPVKLQCYRCRKCFTGHRCTRHHCSLIAVTIRATLHSFDYTEAELNIP